MSPRHGPGKTTDPDPARPTYFDGEAGSEEQREQPDGGGNVGATYTPGTVRTTGNVILGVIALLAFVILIGLYVLFLALR